MQKNLAGFRKAVKNRKGHIGSLSLGSRRPEKEHISCTPTWTQTKSQVPTWRAREYSQLAALRKETIVSSAEDPAIVRKSRRWAEDLPQAACQCWSPQRATTSWRCNSLRQLSPPCRTKAQRMTTNSIPPHAITKASLISIWARTATTSQFLRTSRAWTSR